MNILVLDLRFGFGVLSSLAIILLRRRKLVALLQLWFGCSAVPWVCLRFVIVVFPDRTHYFCLFVTVPRICLRSLIVAFPGGSEVSY